MATTTNSWQLKFLDANSEKVQFTYPHAKATASASDVKAAMNSMIANNTIWQKNPAVLDSARLITRTVTDIDIS